MPGQFDNLTVSGQDVSILFPTKFTLPPTVQVNKISDHEIEVDVTYTIKTFFGIKLTRKGTLYWNADTGTFKFTV